MNIFWATMLGLIQGATEFFPVSSSAHLFLVPYLFNVDYAGLAFDIALHAGTFFAILFVFRKDWLGMAKGIFEKDKTTNKLLFALVLTSIPGGILGYFFESKAETVFRNPLISASVLIGFGLLLYLVDKTVQNTKSLEKMSKMNATLIGVSQGLALIPGVSRSGATITAARALGYSRETAVKYSFLAALPIIAGATVFGLKDVPLTTLLSANWVAGFFASFAASIIAMRFLTTFVKKNDFSIFLYYRVILGLIIFLTIIIRG